MENLHLLFLPIIKTNCRLNFLHDQFLGYVRSHFQYIWPKAKFCIPKNWFGLVQSMVITRRLWTFLDQSSNCCRKRERRSKEDEKKEKGQKQKRGGETEKQSRVDEQLQQLKRRRKNSEIPSSQSNENIHTGRFQSYQCSSRNQSGDTHFEKKRKFEKKTCWNWNWTKYRRVMDLWLQRYYLIFRLTIPL